MTRCWNKRKSNFSKVVQKLATAVLLKLDIFQYTLHNSRKYLELFLKPNLSPRLFKNCSVWAQHIVSNLINLLFFLKGPFPASFSLFSSFQYTVDSKQMFNINKFLPGFEPQTSDIRSHCSTSWTTTTAQKIYFTHTMTIVNKCTITALLYILIKKLMKFIKSTLWIM